MRIKLKRNKVLPEVSLELLCGEATAVPDMKNSPATIRFFFFSDAEWNSPSLCGRGGVGHGGAVGVGPAAPSARLAEALKATVRLDIKASVPESLYTKRESAECPRHPDSTPV